MVKKKKDFFKVCKDIISLTMSTLSLIVNLILDLFLVIGSLASLLMLYKYYPEKFYYIMNNFMPIIQYLFLVGILLISFLISFTIIYLLLKYLLNPLMLKRDKLLEEKRNKYREELVNDLIKRLKKNK